MGDPEAGGSEIPDLWQVFVNGAPCVVRASYVRQHAPDPGLEDNAAIDVGEVWGVRPQVPEEFRAAGGQLRNSDLRAERNEGVLLPQAEAVNPLKPCA